MVKQKYLCEILKGCQMFDDELTTWSFPDEFDISTLEKNAKYKVCVDRRYPADPYDSTSFCCVKFIEKIPDNMLENIELLSQIDKKVQDYLTVEIEEEWFF